MSDGAPPGIDVLRVTEWLVREVPGIALPITFRHISGGRSNLTYRVDDAAGRSWALRRPPTGEVLATAHDMQREWQFLAALTPTPVPVPVAVAYCGDPAVTGAPFYLMKFADGIVLATGAEGVLMAPAVRARVAESTVDALVALHDQDFQNCGLQHFHRPGNFVERQLRRWHRQAHSSAVPDLRLLDEVFTELLKRVPTGRECVAHGDFRPGNIVYAADGSVTAVLDWELAAVGDPTTDLAWLLASWYQDGDLVDPITPGPTEAGGYPDRDVLVARYAARSGVDISDLDYYLAFARWRFACVLSGVYTRELAGVMAGPARTDRNELDALQHQLEGARSALA